MTTELFPKADKVLINLSSESVSVPEGKVWVVSIVANFGSVEIADPSGSFYGSLDAGNDRADSSISRLTLHEEMSVETSDSNACHIAGWEFNYEA